MGGVYLGPVPVMDGDEGGSTEKWEKAELLRQRRQSPQLILQGALELGWTLRIIPVEAKEI